MDYSLPSMRDCLRKRFGSCLAFSVDSVSTCISLHSSKPHGIVIGFVARPHIGIDPCSEKKNRPAPGDRNVPPYS